MYLLPAVLRGHVRLAPCRAALRFRTWVMRECSGGHAHHNQLSVASQKLLSSSLFDSLNVFVVQPFSMATDNKMNRDLYMMETVGLVNTLGWNMVGSMFVSTDRSVKRSEQSIFGSGQLENIAKAVHDLENPSEPNTQPVIVSGVFVSVYQLWPAQRWIMETELKKPIFDRYSIVLEIFKRHATSREAKLQIRLAEIPHLQSRLLAEYEAELISKHDPSVRKSSLYFDSKRAALAKEETKIKTEIEHLQQHRGLLRKKRIKMMLPTVAVVGYTNAGKTSLIKALTGTCKLKPEDKLFATLDVTSHAALLPCNLKLLFIDTVGFISDIPIDLVEAFRSTLEDASSADLIVHVRDVSHPDHMRQNEVVMKTLMQLGVSDETMQSMVVLGNKMDLLSPQDWQEVLNDGMLPVSTTRGFGLTQAVNLIENALIQVTGRKKVTFRVKFDSDEYQWISKNIPVCQVQQDENEHGYCFVTAIVLPIEMNRFQKYFIYSSS